MKNCLLQYSSQKKKDKDNTGFNQMIDLYQKYNDPTSPHSKLLYLVEFISVNDYLRDLE